MVQSNSRSSEICKIPKNLNKIKNKTKYIILKLSKYAEWTSTRRSSFKFFELFRLIILKGKPAFVFRDQKYILN